LSWYSKQRKYIMKKWLLTLGLFLLIISCGGMGNKIVVYDTTNNNNNNSGSNSSGTGTNTPPEPTMIPVTVNLNGNSHYTFTPIFGTAPYTYSIISGGGTVNASTGEFTAPNYYDVTVIEVTDAEGLTATCTITTGGGEILTFGGVGASGVVDTIYHTTDGTSWQTEHLPVAIKGATASILNNTIFVMGGYTTAEVDTVYSSLSGLTGEWNSAGTLPETAYLGGSAVLNDVMYFYSSSSYGHFFKSSNGSIWTAATSAAEMRRYLNLIAFDNKIFALGGMCPDPNLWATIQYTANGTSWTVPGNSLYQARHGGASTVFKGKAWYIGGMGNSCAAPIIENNIWNSTDGLTWTDTGATFPIAFFNAGITVHNGKIWIIGGATAGDCYGPTAFSKAVYSSSDGLNWIQVADLPEAISEFDAVSFSGQ
jgi:hypothetical protein